MGLAVLLLAAPLALKLYASHDRTISLLLDTLTVLCHGRSPTSTTRRDAVKISAGLAASATIAPAFAGLPFDPIGAYSMGAGAGAAGFSAPVPVNLEKPNTGIILLREVFDGGLPASGLVEWYEEHLTEDFQAVFAGGAAKLNKRQYIGITADILKSFPDFVYTRNGPIAYADSPTRVAWKAVVKGTHSGAPYSPLPGVPPVSPKSPPIVCTNDEESIVVTFASGTKLTKIKQLTVEAVPGGRGFSGPIGLFLQAGGDPSKLPK